MMLWWSRQRHRIRYISWRHELGSCSPGQELVARAHHELGTGTVETVEIGAQHCIFLFVGSNFAIWRVADEGCVGLAAGVAARAWVGLNISG